MSALVNDFSQFICEYIAQDHSSVKCLIKSFLDTAAHPCCTQHRKCMYDSQIHLVSLKRLNINTQNSFICKDEVKKTILSKRHHTVTQVFSAKSNNTLCNSTVNLPDLLHYQVYSKKKQGHRNLRWIKAQWDSYHIGLKLNQIREISWWVIFQKRHEIKILKVKVWMHAWDIIIILINLQCLISFGYFRLFNHYLVLQLLLSKGRKIFLPPLLSASWLQE